MREALFMGMVTASASHEMQNVLAIIRESAGLMGDLITMGRASDPRHSDKMDRAMGCVRQHVERGRNLLEALNRLAHATDEAQRERADLEACAKSMAQLGDRFARMKNAALRHTPGDRALVAKACALLVMMSVFDAVQCCLQADPKDVEFRLTVEPEGDRGAIVLTPWKGAAAPEQYARELAATLASAGGSMTAAGDTLRLSFPLAPSCD